MVEEPVRIRLPNDYNFKDYDEQILQSVTKRFVECKAYGEAEIALLRENLAYYGYRPPTKWQKFKRRLQDYRQRAKNIWTILRGGDIHEDCGY